MDTKNSIKLVLYIHHSNTYYLYPIPIDNWENFKIQNLDDYPNYNFISQHKIKNKSLSKMLDLRIKTVYHRISTDCFKLDINENITLIKNIIISKDDYQNNIKY